MRFAIVLLAACGSSSSTKREPPPPPPPTAGSASGSAAPTLDELIPPSLTMRCLPVVAKKCNCTYDCKLGESSDREKTFRIDWQGKEITGVIENYCVDGKCTDVFAVDLTCDGICPRKAANPNCRLEVEGAVECKS